MAASEVARTYFCAFCHRPGHQAKLIIDAGAVAICDECVDVCTEVIADKRAKRIAAEDAKDKPADELASPSAEKEK